MVDWVSESENCLIVDHEGLFELLVVKYMAFREAISNGDVLPKPLFVWGPVGVGKSTTIIEFAKHIAKEEGRKFVINDYSKVDGEHLVVIDKRLAHEDPTSIGGALWFNEDRTYMKRTIPQWIYAITKQRERELGEEFRVILFFDEFDHADGRTQNTVQQLVHDRHLEDYELSDGVFIVLAGNGQYGDSTFYTTELPENLKTRFSHVFLPPPVFRDDQRNKGWFFWALKNSIDSRILAFLSMRPSLLWMKLENSKVYPTPRAWHRASLELRYCNDDMAWKIVATYCGYSVGIEFKKFLEMKTKISVEEAINEPEKFLKLGETPDGKMIQFALIPELVAKFKENPKEGDKILGLSIKMAVGMTDETALNEYAQCIVQMLKDKSKLQELQTKKQEIMNREHARLGGNYSNKEFAMTLIHMMKYAFGDPEKGKKYLILARKKISYAPILAELLKYRL